MSADAGVSAEEKVKPGYRSPWLMVAVASMAVLALYVVLFGVPPIIPTLVSDVGMTHEQAGLLMTVSMLTYCLGSVLGATFGAVFITLLPELLKLAIDAVGGWLPVENIFPALREIIFGLLIVLFLLREPEGLAKLWWDIKAYWKLWPFAY